MVVPTDDRTSKPDLDDAREHGKIVARLDGIDGRLAKGDTSIDTMRSAIATLSAQVAVIQSQWGSHSALIARYVAPILVVLAVEAFKTYVLKR